MIRLGRWLRRVLFGALGVLLLGGIARVWVGAIASARLEAELARIRAAGEPLTLAAALPPIPEAENAAPLLAAAWARVEPEGESEGAMAFLMDPQTAPEASLLAAAAWVERSAPALELLSKALEARPRCQFGPPARAADLRFEEIPGVHRLGRVLATRAHLACRRGDAGAALPDARELDRLGDRVAQSPLLIHRIVGSAIQAVGARVTEHALQRGRPTAEACRAAEASLGSSAPVRLDRTVALTERAYGSELFDRAAEDARARDAMVVLGGEGSSWLCALAPGPALALDHARWLRLWSQALPMAARPWSESGSAWTELENDTRRGSPWYARASSGGVWAFAFAARRLAVNDARRHLARLALRLELDEQATGKLPERLEDLKDPLAGVDPVSGLPYVYRKTDEGRGYLLYAFGANRKDDGGAEEDATNGPHGDDIAFRRPAR